MTDNLGEQVRAARRCHGLTQRELAARSGVALRTLRGVEVGRVRSPRAATAVRLLIGSGAQCTVRVLGAVEIVRAGTVASVGSMMEASVLVLLAARPGAVVSRASIAAALWPTAPPRSWPNLVQTYVSRLRRRLAPDRIAAVGNGYRLDLRPAQVDAARFRDAVARAGPDDARVLEEALREWRGPIAGVTAGVLNCPVVAELEALRVAAAVRFACVAPDHGRAADAIELLAPLAAAHPDDAVLCRAFAGLLAVPEPRRRSEAHAQQPANRALVVRLLGSVSATVGGAQVRISGSFGRTVLAALAVEPGRTVSVNRLIELLWDGIPPATAREQVHTQVYRLRRALGMAGAAAALETVPVGYRLRAEWAGTDVATATETLVRARAAKAAGRFADAVVEYRRAEALWQGPVLGGVTAAFAARHAPGLAEWRQAVAEERIAAELECAPTPALLPELDAMIRVHPLREELHRLRMLALHRVGRRGDALRAFGSARTILRRELGLDPSPALQALEAEILNEGNAAPATLDPSPAQLPPCPHGFTGRAEESAVLHRLLTRDPGAAARVAVVSGMPGIGKTALAVHAATLASGHFPDGRLYANLYGAADAARPPAAVLGDLLRSLGASPAQLPDDVAGRTAALRTLSARRRVLLLLDDAVNEDQVEPLLLAGWGCATLVTSRSTLAGLDPSCRVNLAPLTDDAARAVLATGAGPDRIAREPTAVADILRACAGLPLALRIIGARLATRPDLAVTDVTARLRDENRRLGELAAGRRSVRASLARSHRLLSGSARIALAEVSRLGADAAGWMISALCDLPVGDTERVIDELVGLHMLEATASQAEFGPRFRPHDLVRVYAGCGERDDSDTAALTRLLVRAVFIASAARTALTGAMPSGLVRGVLDRQHVDPEWLRPACNAPERWFAAERGVLLALVHAAADSDLPTHAAAVLESITPFLVRLNLLDDRAGAARRVAASTTGSNAPPGPARPSRSGRWRYTAPNSPRCAGA